MVVALGVCLHSGGFDGDDDPPVAEVLDTDPFGTREEFVDIEGDCDEERVAWAVHPLEWEVACKVASRGTWCRLSRC